MAQVRALDGVNELIETIDLDLNTPEFSDLGARLHTLGVHGCDASTLLAQVHSAGRASGIGGLKAQMSLRPRDVSVERWLLLQAMKASLPRLPELPVPPAVKQLLL